MPSEKINLDAEFHAVAGHWQPQIIAALNGQEVKIAKVQGVFPWHMHEKEDEFFLVWKGCLHIEFRGGRIALEAGEAFVVPRGVEHRTLADEETFIMMFEPATIINPGHIYDER